MAIITTLLAYVPLLLLVYLITTILKLALKRWRLQKAFRHFPGPRPRFLTGNMAELTGDYAGMQRIVELGQRYPEAYPVWMGPTDAQLMAASGAAARAVLLGTDPKDESYALMKPWIGDGLMLSKGQKWDRNRRLICPAFHQQVLRNHVAVFGDTSSVLVAKWREAGARSVEVFHHISLLTLDTMLRCLFGHQSNCQNEQTRHAYIQGVYDVSELIVKRPTNNLHRYDSIYYLTENGKRFKKACDTIHAHSEAIIRERRKLIGREKHGSRNIDFMDILLSAQDEDGVGLSDPEIRDEVDTFMFGGHDSSASTISWCLYNLARHPDCQERCRAEIRRVVGAHRQITWQDLSRLEYTYMCIQESMRLYPAVPNVSRCLEKDVTFPDGRVVIAGTRVAVSLFAVHRDPEVWENPDEFEPARFAPGQVNSSAHFMPFSVGPRNCIGKQFALTEIRFDIATILLNFRLLLDPARRAEVECHVILRSKNGLHLILEPLS